MKKTKYISPVARYLAGLLAATVAICTLSFFIEPANVEAAVLSSNGLVSEADTKKAGYTYESSFRNEILMACSKMNGVKYQWGGSGSNGIDCAGSVSIAYSAALGTVWIGGTSGSYGNKTLSYSGGGAPDRYGFYWPGYAGIKSSFTNELLKKRGITPTENRFSSFEYNGVSGIQSEEWISIIDKYGIKPGDMILWWNDSNDSVNPQHITIYAGIENGVPMHWTASSTAGYFCKKPLADSSSEAGKGSFTGFMGLKATGLRDSVYVGFTLDKRDPSGINHTGAVFSAYSDSELSNKIGELRDDDGNGVYSDYYALKNGNYSKGRYVMTSVSGKTTYYEDAVYFKETTAPTGLVLDDGTAFSLEDAEGNVPDIYKFTDDSVYVAKMKLVETSLTTGKLDYSVSKSGGDTLYSTSISDYSFKYGSEVAVITNMRTTDSTLGRGKGGGLFTEASSISLAKTTSSEFDTTTTVFTITEGAETVATYKYSDDAWHWYDASGKMFTGTAFPVKYGTEYTVTEHFASPEAFKCVDGTELDYKVSNDSGWTRADDTTYTYTFTSGDRDSLSVYDITCENNKASGKIEVLKSVADADDSCEGFVFELWNLEKTKKLADGNSASDGKVYWKTGSDKDLTSFEVPSGTYVLTERKPAKYYKNSTDEYVYLTPEGFVDGGDGKWNKEITVGTDTHTESITNDRIESSIKVLKSSEDNEIKDVEFKLYYGGKSAEPVWQSSPIDSGFTDVAGILNYKNLPIGWYKVEENIKPIYKAVWNDGTEGNTKIVRITENDDNKTLEFSAYNKLDINPLITTTLTDTDLSHDINCGKNVELTDKVHVKDLTSGYEYTVKGRLVDKTTGDVLRDRDGNEYVQSVSFFADSAFGVTSLDSKGREVVEGDIEVGFVIDSAYLFEAAFEQGFGAFPVVCVEELYFRGTKIAEHKDLSDENQTVTVAPSIRTSASDNATGTGVLALSEYVGITDKVSFKGLAPGETYVATGTLMDKSTAQPYQDSDGNTYTGRVEFVPGSSNGYVLVEFENVKVPLDSIDLVVFETVRVRNDRTPVAVHEDINDEEQTLTRPTCSTYAATVKGDKAFLKNSNVTIVDHVSYDNLEVGQVYYAKAALYVSDGTGVVSKGQEVVSIQEFVPEQKSGMVDVTLKFNSKNLKSGERVVVTENIYDMSTEEEIAKGIQPADVQVLSHEDLNNMAQSLTVADVPMSGEFLNAETIIGLVVFAVSSGAAAVAVVIEIRRKRAAR